MSRVWAVARFSAVGLGALLLFLDVLDAVSRVYDPLKSCDPGTEG